MINEISFVFEDEIITDQAIVDTFYLTDVMRNLTAWQWWNTKLDMTGCLDSELL